MHTIPEALEILMAAFAPLGHERVALADAFDRTLAANLDANTDSPAFDNSAMDGYAVRSAELGGANAAAPLRLDVVLESRAGGNVPQALPTNACGRIFTGAPVPDGADAVVMQEDVMRDGDAAIFAAAAAAGAHIRRRGGDLARNTPMLASGARLGAAEIGLLASQGHAIVSVYRRPRVAILSTGDELRDLGEPARVNGERDLKIINSNAYALAAQVREAGGEALILPRVADDRGLIETAMREALAADVVMTCGGVSVGDYDFMHDVFAAVGVVNEFRKVRIKPGKPLTFGRAGRVPVVGLPGNPVSAMVTFEAFVRPALRRMVGDPQPYREAVEVPLAHDYRRRPGRPELARGRLLSAGGGDHLELAHSQGSGSLVSMVGANALALLPAETTELAAGTPLAALRLDTRRGQANSPFERLR